MSWTTTCPTLGWSRARDAAGWAKLGVALVGDAAAVVAQEAEQARRSAFERCEVRETRPRRFRSRDEEQCQNRSLSLSADFPVESSHPDNTMHRRMSRPERGEGKANRPLDLLIRLLLPRLRHADPPLHPQDFPALHPDLSRALNPLILPTPQRRFPAPPSRLFARRKKGAQEYW